MHCSDRSHRGQHRWTQTPVGWNPGAPEPLNPVPLVTPLVPTVRCAPPRRGLGRGQTSEVRCWKSEVRTRGGPTTDSTDSGSPLAARQSTIINSESKMPLKAHLKAHQKARFRVHRKVPWKAQSKAHFIASFIAHFRARLIASCIARLKAQLIASFIARFKVQSKARVKAPPKTQLKAHFTACFMASSKANSKAA
jgi:hypothetical protein